jgi:hypothetical protein
MDTIHLNLYLDKNYLLYPDIVDDIETNETYQSEFLAFFRVSEYSPETISKKMELIQQTTRNILHFDKLYTLCSTYYTCEIDTSIVYLLSYTHFHLFYKCLRDHYLHIDHHECSNAMDELMNTLANNSV